jgi:hypothetical protein
MCPLGLFRASGVAREPTARTPEENFGFSGRGEGDCDPKFVSWDGYVSIHLYLYDLDLDFYLQCISVLYTVYYQCILSMYIINVHVHPKFDSYT